MTGGDEEPNGDTANRKRADSRFDKFLDRFADDEPEEQSTSDSDSERPEPEAGTPGSDPETADRDPDTEGWIWGSPKQAADDESISAADRDPEEEPSDTELERLWNVGFDDLRDADGSVTESFQRQPDEMEDETATPVGHEASERKDAGPNGQTEAGDGSEPTDHDRWAELGARLSEPETQPDDPSEAQSTDASGGTDRAEDEREIRDNADEPPWAQPEATTAGDARAARTSPLSGNEQSAALDRVTDSASVLLLGPTDHPVADTICSRFVVGDEGSRNCLFITFQDDPNDRIDVCHHADDWTGGDIGVIEVGRGRGASETTSSAGSGSITVRHVSNPGDLSKLGIVITQLLAEFDETPQQTALCFHTLSALHNQVGTKTLFRFLNTLQSRLLSSNAVGHYHMDPELHDEIVIETLRPIFDSVVRYSADGDLSVE